MRIEFYLEANEEDIPIEIANALIKARFEGVNSSDLAEIARRELAEIAEHIQVFLKYNSGGAE